MTVTAPHSAREELLEFCELNGRYIRQAVQGEQWVADDDTGTQTRLVRFGGGGPLLLQKAVPVAVGQRLPLLYDRLENEIRGGVRLAERYRRSYPPELFRLVGYNFDVEVPYVLMEPPRGRPIGELAGKLLLEEQQFFAVSLLRGLQLLDEAGVVHEGLRPGVVFWDGAHVQLFDFGLSAMTGEPGRETAPTPWAAPERRNPGHTAAASDDVWSAGMIIYHMVTGRPPSQAANVADLDARGWLRRLLDGVFSPAGQSRPTATDLLLRSRAGVVPPVVDPLSQAEFEAGCEEFDRVRADKRGPVRATVPLESVPTRSRRKFPWVLLIVVLLAVAGGVFYLLNRG